MDDSLYASYNKNIALLDYCYDNPDKVFDLFEDTKKSRKIKQSTRIQMILMANDFDRLHLATLSKKNIKILLNHAIRLMKFDLGFKIVELYPGILKSFIKRNNHLKHTHQNEMSFLIKLYNNGNEIISNTFEFKNPYSFETYSMFSPIFRNGPRVESKKNWFFKEYSIEDSYIDYSFVDWILNTSDLEDFLNKTIGFHGKSIKKLFYKQGVYFKNVMIPLGLLINELFKNNDVTIRLLQVASDFICEMEKEIGKNFNSYFSSNSISCKIDFATDKSKLELICNRLRQISSKKKIKNEFEKSFVWNFHFVDALKMLLTVSDDFIPEIKRYIQKEGFSFDNLHYVLCEVIEKQKRMNFSIDFKYYKKVMKIMDKYEDYEIRYPKDSNMLFTWGLDLSNCIGTADYSERAKKNEILLLGLFKDNELKYTVEISRKGTVIQCEGHKRLDIENRESFNTFVRSKFREAKK